MILKMENAIKKSTFPILIPHWIFISLFTFPALPLKVTNILFITFSVYVLFYWLIYKPIGIWKTLRKNLVLSLPFIPYLLEFIFHYDNYIMQFEFQKKLLFFIAPVSTAIYFAVFNPKNIRACFNVFAASVSLLSIYTILLLIRSGTLFNEETFDNGAYLFRTSFEHFSHLHPTYFGLFASTAALWLVYNFENYAAKWKYIIVLFISILLFLILMVAAKMPLFILVLGTIWIIYKKVKRKGMRIFLYLSIVLVGFGVIFIIPSLSSRVGEVSTYYSSEKFTIGSMFQREVIYDCNIKIALANFWTGTGARNSQFLLDYCYSFRSAGTVETNKFNSHNQFLTLLVNYGIVILTIFMLSFIFLWRRIKHFPFGIVIIGSFLFIMLTESILERQMGIYFYTLFSLLILNSKKSLFLND